MNIELANKIAKLTEDNMHTEALIVKAQAMQNDLGDAFATVLQEIADEIELDGFLSPLNNELRYAIDKKLRAFDKFLGLA